MTYRVIHAWVGPRGAESYDQGRFLSFSNEHRPTPQFISSDRAVAG